MCLHVSMCCSVLQCVAIIMSDTATHCNTLQHTATHCNTLQHIATHGNTLQHTTTHYDTLQHTTTHCNTLQHTTTHYNTLSNTCAPEIEREGMMRLGWHWCCSSKQFRGKTRFAEHHLEFLHCHYTRSRFKRPLQRPLHHTRSLIARHTHADLMQHLIHLVSAHNPAARRVHAPK